MGYISEMRKYIGHSPIMVTAAMCIIYDKEKGILFEKRSDNGMWCVPGGAIELGESLEQALAREVKEETSLDISNPKLFDVAANVHMIYPNKDEVYYTDVVYEVNEYTGTLKYDEESTELKWFKINELPESIMPTQIEYIRKFVNMLK
ncbi:MAG: NUDIX domain-containing protein [Clostridia bacterium]|nr:NUDIX domain-containing protein [Clostridia bacterium]